MSAIKICLDAGHFGKYNQSPAVKSYYESDMNWKLHLLLKKYLEEYGFVVTTTRADKNVNMNEYYRGTASKGCDLFISLHSNAVGSSVNENVDYPVVYVPLNGKGNAIGQKLVDCVEAIMDTKQNGRIATRRGQNGDYYGVIRGATAVGTVGLIIEHSFHTNTRATKWLLSNSNLEKMAKAEADVIAAYYGVEKPTKPVVEPEHWYRIRKTWDDSSSQKGAYKSLDNAKEACPEGYSVFDWEGKAVYTKTAPKAVYTQKQFVMDVQKAIAAKVDGIPGGETLSKTVTVSARINCTHAVVKPLQKKLYALGYTDVGEADGIAGPLFEKAVRAFQNANGCVVDGEITAGCKTWKKLLGMK